MFNSKNYTAPGNSRPEGFFPTPNISESQNPPDYFLTTFDVHDFPRYS